MNTTALRWAAVLVTVLNEELDLRAHGCAVREACVAGPTALEAPGI